MRVHLGNAENLISNLRCKRTIKPELKAEIRIHVRWVEVKSLSRLFVSCFRYGSLLDVLSDALVRSFHPLHFFLTNYEIPRRIRCVHGCCQSPYQYEDDGPSSSASMSVHVKLTPFFAPRSILRISRTRSSTFSSRLKTWIMFRSDRPFAFIVWPILNVDRVFCLSERRTGFISYTTRPSVS